MEYKSFDASKAVFTNKYIPTDDLSLAYYIELLIALCLSSHFAAPG